MKKEQKFIKKIIQSMISLQKDASRFAYVSGSTRNLVKIEHADTVAYTYDISGRDPSSFEELSLALEDYLQGKGKDIKLPTFNVVNQKAFVGLIIKEKPDDALLQRLISLNIGSDPFMRHDSNIEYAVEYCHKSKKPEDKLFAKNFCLKLVPHVRSSVGSSLYSHTFERTLHPLSFFNFEQQDLPVIHGFLATMDFKAQHNWHIQSKVVEFLKKSVAPEYWIEFQEYFGKTVDLEKKDGALFEEKTHPSYQLIISNDYLIANHPVISLGSDLKMMMERIVNTFNENASTIGLEEAYILRHLSGNDKNKTKIYFLSANEDDVNKRRIQAIFSQMSELYIEAFTNKQDIDDKFLNQAFNACVLAQDLEEKKKDSLLKKSKRVKL